MNQMLRGVVESGTGMGAAIPGYTPAGKTGTARIVQPGGGYTDAEGVTHYDATFVGFVPAEAPALSMFVWINDPVKSIFGGVVAAPAFAKIGAAALQQFGVPPPSSDLAAGGGKVTRARTIRPGHPHDESRWHERPLRPAHRVRRRPPAGRHHDDPSSPYGSHGRPAPAPDPAAAPVRTRRTGTGSAGETTT